MKKHGWMRERDEEGCFGDKEGEINRDVLEGGKEGMQFG